MKRCPFCAEEIQDAAIVCKHCQRDLNATSVPKKASPAPKTSHTAIGCAVMVVGLFVVISLIGQFSRPTPSTPPGSDAVKTPTESPAPQTPLLALLASRGYESSSGGYHYVEGQVKNLGAESLEHVAAHVTWFTNEGQFITSDDAVVDFNPLLPGQTSSFKTITRSNPAMSRYSVEFKRLFGGAIPHRDDRAAQKSAPTKSPRSTASTAAPEPGPPPSLALNIQRVREGWQISNLSPGYTWRGCVVQLDDTNTAKLPDLRPLATALVQYSEFNFAKQAEAASDAWVSCKAGGQTYTTNGR